MKLWNEWCVPDTETMIGDIVMEWKNKSTLIINKCKKKEIVVQAGGHVGIFPIGLSKHFRQVITFEAVPTNFECLVENIQVRELHNIDYYSVGLGRERGSANISATKQGNSGATQLVPTDMGDITLTTIDDLNLVDLDLLWLDIEGMEVDALEGARNTIRKFQPIIVLENNGLIFAKEFRPDGEEELREYMKENFDYTLQDRLMRDDIYAPRGY